MVEAAVAFGTGFVRLALGLGAGVLFTPVLALVMDPARAVLTMAPLAWVTYVHGTARRWAHRDWQALVPVIGPALLGLAVGTPLLALAPPEVLRRVIGAAALAAGLLQLVRREAEAGPAAVPRLGAAGVGFVVGVIGALVGTHGILLGLYMARVSRTKEAFIANMSVGLLVIDTARIALYLATGAGDRTALLWPLLFTPLVLAGGVAGALLHDRLSRAVFFRALSVAISAIGVALLVR